MQTFKRGKGNKPINKSDAKRVEEGKIISGLPLIPYNGERVPLFQVRSPTRCPICGSHLNVNKLYDRYILSSYGVLQIPVTYWECPSCKDFYCSDQIVGVLGSNNYSDEVKDKEYYTRNGGKTSLWNAKGIGELWIRGEEPRAPCPATLWRYDQLKGRVALEELRNEEVNFNGTLHLDGYYIKCGWRKYLEKQLGRGLNRREWRHLRNKVIWVCSTEEKVILDFELTDLEPSFFQLIPLLSRIKERLGEGEIKKVVSDEDWAIIGSVEAVLPNAVHSFCVFHQLEKLTRIYLDKFRTLDKVPDPDREFYGLCKELILAEDAVNSSVIFKELQDMPSSRKLSYASRKAMDYLSEVYKKNRKLLEKGFTPETNNVMEQLFSFINDFAFMCRSFKIEDGLKNWASNLFLLMNHRPFNTGLKRGVSPIQTSGEYG
jgi:hypothetical protein